MFCVDNLLRVRSKQCGTLSSITDCLDNTTINTPLTSYVVKMNMYICCICFIFHLCNTAEMNEISIKIVSVEKEKNPSHLLFEV